MGTWGYIILAIVVCLVIYVMVTYNKLVKGKNSMQEAFATMDVYLKKRWDMIPNLVESVKGYAAHEKATLESLVASRSKSYDSLTNEEKMAASAEMSQSIRKLLAIAENYPDLKANQNFMQLNAELAQTEDEIANSRKYFNAVVRNYNNMTQMFPSNIVASLFGHKAQAMFEAADAERENVKVEF